MAEIRKYWLVRHLRSEQNAHVLVYRGGKLVTAGRGLAFWFLPMKASIAEVPVDDRELSFLFHGTSSDHQETVVQGTLTWRVTHPELLAQRVEFTVDLDTGRYRREPLEQVAGLLTNLAQRFAEACTAGASIRGLIESGVTPLRDRIEAGFAAETALGEMGIAVGTVHVASVRPSSDLEKALQTPARESIQQGADQATFGRRASAVEQERAIAENELKNRIELARQEIALIDQRGVNGRREAEEAAVASLIVSEGESERTLVTARGEAESITLVEKSNVDAERARIDIYRDLPQGVMMGLAARDLAANLTSIEHLSVSPELLGPLLTQLVAAGTDKLRA
jgi:hypothetical protein